MCSQLNIVYIISTILKVVKTFVIKGIHHPVFFVDSFDGSVDLKSKQVLVNLEGQVVSKQDHVDQQRRE
jgi:hypothetical protein